jgi:hypothetical protein
MKNLFKKKTELNTLDQNKQNGKSVERYFAANLTITLNARVFWATRTEDDSKVDLVTVMSHPWKDNNVDVIFTQVKSGPTYCNVVKGKLKVKKKQFTNLLNKNHNTLVCWSLADLDTPYWFIIKSNAKYFRTNYNENHKLTPISRLDISRILISYNNTNGGKGLTFSVRNNSFLEKRKEAKQIYNNLKTKIIKCPLLGQIEFSRLGWRHITRKDRHNSFKINSFDIMPILEKVLERTPSKHFCNKTDFWSDNLNEYRACEYILTYNDVQCLNKIDGSISATNIYVKILEYTSYRKNWRQVANFSTFINRRVILKSVYYKEKSS